MNEPVANAHSVLDGFIAGLTEACAKAKNPVRCAGPGCCACCFEPVFVERSEVIHLLKRVAPEDRAGLIDRVRNWWDRFWAKEFNLMPRPSQVKAYGWLMKYRGAMLPCPLLVNGRCSVYANRPGSCRMHIALGSPRRCEDDSKRPKQKFLDANGLFRKSGGMNVATACLADNAPTAFMEYDHLGIWLGRLLLGETKGTLAANQVLMRQSSPLPDSVYGIIWEKGTPYEK